jgi:hypothetical protein
MVNQQLLDYISAQKNSGVSADGISKNLLGVGWTKPDVDEALKTLGMVSAPLPIPVPLASVVSENSVPVIPAEKAPEVQSAAVYGDGSLVNVFDLGLPSKNPEYQPSKPQSEELVKEQTGDVKPAENMNPVPGMVEHVWAKPVVTEPPTTVPVVPVVSASPPSKGLNKFTILGIVFIGMGILVGAVWWFVSQNRTPIVSSPTETMSPVATLSPTIAVQTVKSDLLADEEFVSVVGFKVIPPKDWRIDESGSFGTLATFSSLMIDEDKGNKFVANINVVSEEAKETTLDEYLKSSKELLLKTFTSYKVEREEKVKIGTYDGVVIEATYEMGVFSLRNMQLIVLVKDTAYVITGTSLVSTWETYKNQISASLMTFAI